VGEAGKAPAVFSRLFILTTSNLFAIVPGQDGGHPSFAAWCIYIL
jgi:hypothetical protein